MSTASSLDPDAGAAPGIRPPGRDAAALGPSDLSDSGSDSLGPTGLDEATLGDTSDSAGTGVDPTPIDDDGDGATDIGFDRVVDAAEAGLGSGLDQAEEARLGVTDDALDPHDEAGAALAPDPDAQRALRDLRRAEMAQEDDPDDDDEDADGDPDDVPLFDRTTRDR